jgi:hypothetical protein
MKDKRSIEAEIFVYNEISFYISNSMPPSGRVMFGERKEIVLGGLILCKGNYAQYGVLCCSHSVLGKNKRPIYCRFLFLFQNVVVWMRECRDAAETVVLNCQ